MALGEEAIKEFFDRIDNKSEENRDAFYNVIFIHLLHHINEDSETFVLKTRPDAFVHIPDFRDRILILERLRKHFIEVEIYEFINGIDKMISLYRKMIDDI